MNIIEILKNSEQQNIWEIGNQVLYDLCIKYPKHNDEKEVIAKIWLIGRSYAATIERRKTTDDYINDDYYTKNVIPKILHSEIDKVLLNLDLNNNETILKAHSYLTNLFKDISGQEKRALASKYLHFHFPNIFYIYDSRAVNSLSVLKKILGIKINYPAYINNFDTEYSKFYFGAKKLVDYIDKNYSVKLNCRKFDNLLIEIGNERLRNRK